MYVVKVLHGYIDKEGQRTREKTLRNFGYSKANKNPTILLLKLADAANTFRKFGKIEPTRP